MAFSVGFGVLGDYLIDDNGTPGDGISAVRYANGDLILPVTHPVDDLTFYASLPGLLNLTFSFTDTLGAANLTVGSLADSDLSPATITFGSVRTTGIVTLAANSAIVERGSDAAADIIASQVLLSAGTGIGTGANALETRTSVIEARTTTGGIAISNVGQVQIGGPASDIGGLQVGTSGDIHLTNVGTIVLAEAVATESVRGGATSGNVTLIANGAESNIVSTVDRDSISAPGGAITLQAGNDIAFGLAGASFDNDVRARGAITVIAGHDFLIDGFADLVSDDFGGATGGNVSITAGRNIHLRNVTGSDASITASGNGGADVILTTGAGGSLVVDSATSFAVGSSTGDIIVNSDRVVIAGASGMTAGSGGITIRPATDGLEIDLGSALDSAFALELSDLELDRLFTPTLTIGDNQTGLITVSSSITPANAANLVLRGGTDIAVGAAITTTGALEMRAGDSFFLTAAVAITAGGALSIFIDTVAADAGVGGVADLRNATLSAASITIDGGVDNDTIYGAEAVAQTVHGNGGNDRIISSGEGAYFGDAGDDVILAGLSNGLVDEALDGGDGVDTLDTRSYSGSYVIDLATGSSNFGFETFLNFENIFTGDAADQITGGAGSNVINSGGGNDVIDGGGGSDTMIGGLGDDTYVVNTGTDVVIEANGQGYDIVNTSATFDIGVQEIEEANLTGALNRNLTGGAGINILRGNIGDNILDGRGGADTLEGGDGLDTASYTASEVGVTVNLATGVNTGGHAEGDILTGIENLAGSIHLDMLTGDNAANTLSGDDGDDQLIGGGGDDSLFGGAGLDTLAGGTGADLLDGGEGNDNLSGGADNDDLRGGAGADVLAGATGDDTLQGGQGADTLTGGDGADTLNGGTEDDELNGAAGADAFIGGDGVDTATYLGATASITVNLTTGTGTGGWAQGDTFVGVENVLGSNQADTLTGDAGINELNGASGDDTLNGGLGDDTLLGNVGADVLNGGDGQDLLNGGSDDDALNGGVGNDVLNGGSGIDTLSGGSGDDSLNGGTENDILTGAAGLDTLLGAAGNDNLNGGADNDVLNGGVGDDILAGGPGNDLFVFSGASGSDVINDFTAGAAVGDVISLDSSIFVNFADVLANTADDGLGNTIISKGGVTIRLTGVLEAQLNANDFQFVAPGSPARALEAETAAPAFMDDLDPLILPAGLEGKSAPDEAPVICPPGGDQPALERPFIDLTELGLSSFHGRDPHRFQLHTQDYAWIT